MKTQRKAYRQFRPVFGIASIPNTDFGSITRNIFFICSHSVVSVWKHNAQHLAELSQYLGLHKSQILASIWDSINHKY